MLHSAFIFYPVEQYDVKGKRLLKTLEKKLILWQKSRMIKYTSR